MNVGGEETITALFGGMFCLVWILALLASIGGMVFWVIQLIDVARREFSDPNAKIVWLLVVILGSVIGALVYHFVGKPQGRLPG